MFYFELQSHKIKDITRDRKKLLYEKIRPYLKIEFQLRANLYYYDIPKDLEERILYQDHKNSVVEIILKHINRDNEFIKYLMKGDLVTIDYTNNFGDCVFDGEEMIDLNFDYDDMPSIPKKFKSITEFSLGYFINVLPGITNNVNIDNNLIKNSIFNTKQLSLEEIQFFLI